MDLSTIPLDVLPKFSRNRGTPITEQEVQMVGAAIAAGREVGRYRETGTPSLSGMLELALELRAEAERQRLTDIAAQE